MTPLDELQYEKADRISLLVSSFQSGVLQPVSAKPSVQASFAQWLHEDLSVQMTFTSES